MTLPLASGVLYIGLGLIALLAAILWVLALIDLISKRSDLERTQRWAWILIVVLLPIVGSIIYFAMRPVLDDEREKALKTAGRRDNRGL
jgi:hypothetical protein